MIVDKYGSVDVCVCRRGGVHLGVVCGGIS